MPIPTPTAATEALTLRDIPPLPIFAYVPSLAVWVAVTVLLLFFGWLVLRAPRRGDSPTDAVRAVEDEIERCLARGVPRDGVFSVSRAIKVLLRTRERGDFTADTPGELRRRASEGAQTPLNRALEILAELDESKYRPDRTALEERLRELRAILRPIVEPAVPDSSTTGGAA